MNMVAREVAASAILSRSGQRSVVIAAGGTGGHFFPAEALAAELLARGVPIALLTDVRSGGRQSRVFEGYPVHVLRGAGIAGRGVAKAVRASVALAAGAWQARGLLRLLHPAVIVGFGGYPTVAPVVGSRLLRRRVPVVLHEQNAVLGRTNRALARRAEVVALSFARTARVPDGAVTELTGNPVRTAIAALAGSGYVPPDGGAIRLVVLGGSLGATVLSEVVPAALALLPEAVRARLFVSQQCRAADLDAVRVVYAQAGIAALLDSFFDDVAGLLAGAHLVIARAGASTVAELAVIGRPAILVPLPGAIDDHQAENAASVGGGAWVMRQDGFDAASLSALVARLIGAPAELQAAAAVMATHGRARAAVDLADLVERVIAEAGA